MIEIQHIDKSFNDHLVLEDICMEIEEGTIHGIIGENGVGKTTLLQMIAGIYTVEKGTILVDGEKPYNHSGTKEKIAYIADRNQYFEWYKVKEMVDFFEMSYPTFSREKFNEYNKDFNIPLNKRISQLSKGMQMRLSLMLGFAICAKYLILDEPTSGLDALAKKKFYEMLVEAVEEGSTAILSSHHLNDIERVCDRITMLEDTKVKWEMATTDIKEKVKKLQVVFKEKLSEPLSEWQEIIDTSQMGSIYYIVTDCYTQELYEKLEDKGTVLIEEIPLTLEEIFVYTARAKRGEEKNHGESN